MPFVVCVLIACGAFWLAGGLALQRVRGARPGQLPFTSMLFGQMIVWVVAVLVLPLGAGIDAWLGRSPAIGVWLWGGLAVALALAGRGVEWTSSSAGRVFAAVGIAALVKVALVYSAQSHIGALGLDTHQHIYWVRQLLEAHHVALNERDTPVLALYPRGFHLLTALWSAAGIAGPVGSWVKLMPFLQAWLPCLAFAELVNLAARRQARTGLLAAGLALALVVYAFAISRMAFPEYDLNGTPRFASGAALLFPWLVLVAGRVLDNTMLRTLAIACLPAVALLLLSMNAILLVQFAVFLLPLLGITGWLTRQDADIPRERIAAWAVASCGIAALVCLQDPWIVAQWAPRFAPGYLDLFGVITPDEATNLGLLAKDELVSESAGSALHQTWSDFAWLFFASLAGALRDFLSSGWRFPFSQDLFSDAGRIALRIVILAGAGAGLVALRHERTTLRTLFFALVIGSCAGGFAQLALFHFAEGLAVGRGYEYVLLRDYCEVAAKHVGLPVQGMILLAALGLAMTGWRMPTRIASNAPTWIVAALATSLPFALYGTSESVDPARGFWAPLHHRDLANLRSIETHIGPDEGVLVPAAAWGIGEERWIIPQGATASVLPFSTRRLVFNARLGPSVVFNWRDVVQFCQGSDAQRAAFLARHDVRWFLLKDPAVGSDALHQRFRMCKLRLAQLGVITPPAHVEGNLALYRIDPARMRDATD